MQPTPGQWLGRSVSAPETPVTMNRLAALICGSILRLVPLASLHQSATARQGPSGFLRVNLAVTDTGFLLYWLASAFSLFPAEWLFKDAASPVLLAWNWSFAPLDLAASVSGFLALKMAGGQHQEWRPVALVSVCVNAG